MTKYNVIRCQVIIENPAQGLPKTNGTWSKLAQLGEKTAELATAFDQAEADGQLGSRTRVAWSLHHRLETAVEDA